MAEQSVTDFLFASGAKSAKFENVGDYVKGRIVSASLQQQTSIEGTPLTWANGDPKMQLVVVLATDLRDSDDDDGHRAVYAKGGRFQVASGKGASMKDAIAEAVKAGGGKALDIGSTLTVAHTGLGVAERGKSAPKLYGAKWEPATVTVDAIGDQSFDPLA